MGALGIMGETASAIHSHVIGVCLASQSAPEKQSGDLTISWRDADATFS